MKTRTSSEMGARMAIGNARRIVIKIGSRVLVQASGKPETERIKSLAGEMASLSNQKREIVFVTSGAIGTGMQALGMRRRPAGLAELQMAAAVGQSRLMNQYDRLFAAEKKIIGQVLLTHDDLKHRTRHLNARNTILTMLRAGVIPVINENDVVAVDEIKFGDNDVLSSLVAALSKADELLILTGVDKVAINYKKPDMKEFDTLSVADAERYMAEGQFPKGSMGPKIEAAIDFVKRGGKHVIITSLEKAQAAVDGKAGTKIVK